MTLIEPVVPTPAWAEFVGAHAGPAIQAFATGNPAEAVDSLITPVYGSPDYRSELNHALPEGWFDQCVSDATWMFTVELPATREWPFGPEEASRISQPVLIIHGDNTAPVWTGNVQYLKEWIPGAQEQVVPGADHFSLLTRPGETAKAMATFMAANRIDDPVAPAG